MDIRSKVDEWMGRAWFVPGLFIASFLVFAGAVYAPWGTVSLADWMQLIGTLLAIAGAAAFPYIHEIHRRRQADDDMRRVLLLLAKNQTEQLRLLHSTLYHALYDFGEDTINPYLDGGWHLKWPPHKQALDSIPIAALKPQQLKMLVELKVGADYASSVIMAIDDWDFDGDRERLILKQLAHYREMSQLAVGFLS